MTPLMAELLRRCGLRQTAPGRWEKPGAVLEQVAPGQYLFGAYILGTWCPGRTPVGEVECLHLVYCNCLPRDSPEPCPCGECKWAVAAE